MFKTETIFKRDGIIKGYYDIYEDVKNIRSIIGWIQIVNYQI